MQIMEMARGCNQSFEELPSIDQQLTFSKLSIELIRVRLKVELSVQYWLISTWTSSISI